MKVSKTKPIVQKQHRINRVVNTSKILDYYLPILTDHMEYPVPNWFKKSKAPLSVIVPIKDNIASFIYCYENSSLTDVQYIFVDNNSRQNTRDELFNYFKGYQKAMGKLVLCLQDYSFFDCCKIGSNYADAETLLFLSPYVITQQSTIDSCLPLLTDENAVSPCLVKENGKVFSGGRRWYFGKFFDVGNTPALPVPLDYTSDMRVEPCHSLYPFHCFIRKAQFEKLKQISVSHNDMFLSMNNLLSNNKSQCTILNDYNYSNLADFDDDFFFNKWVVSNRVDYYQEIRGILVKKTGDLTNVEKLVPLLRNMYPGVKLYLLSETSNKLFDKTFKTYQECERLYQFILNFDALHTEDYELYKIYSGLEVIKP